MPVSLFKSVRRRRFRSRGFTLIEMMVVVSILSVLGALAIPRFGDIVERQRVRQAASDLTAAIYLARSEALRRGGQVTLRKVSSPECHAVELKEWSCGWLVFADADNDGLHDAEETRIEAWPARRGVKVELGIGGKGAGAHLKADRWGQFNGLGAFSFRLRPHSREGADASLLLCMSAGGRLRALHGATDCRT
jgi:type IV fimbrial biogenesis protein FimT